MAPSYTIPLISVMFGCDPEMFIEVDGKVVGSEKVIGEEGLAAPEYGDRGIKPIGTNQKAFVRDGVQIELNPSPHACRANLGNEIAASFRTLKEHLKKQGMNAKPCFSAVIQVPEDEFASLSDKSKEFGCAQSFNMYRKDAGIKVDPKVDRTRAAGGHIHVGLSGHPKLMENRKTLIPIMDILVGNTSVLMDRDPANKERRKVYGRAGEYRLPKHGIEYRTLSNFWLKSYQLMHLMMGLTRMSVGILQGCNATTYSEWDHVNAKYNTTPIPAFDLSKELFSLVSMSDIETAINENDVDLAKENFNKIKPFLKDHAIQPNMGIQGNQLPEFDYFIKKIDESGLDYWFPGDPMENWCNLRDGHNNGFEAFMYTIQQDMFKNIVNPGLAA